MKLNIAPDERITVSNLYASNALGFSSASVGGHSARSMMLIEMSALFQELPLRTTKEEFARAVVQDNVLNKSTLSSRKKSLRHLIELYGLDSSKPLFRVLWEFGHLDPTSVPQLCLIGSFARDPQLRGSFELIRSLRAGEVVERVAMEQQLENGYPGRFSPAMKKSMAQNVNTTWTYGGHLAGKAKKTRTLPEPRPPAAAYSMFVAYLSGLRGEQLVDSVYADLVAWNRNQLMSALSLASARGLIVMKHAAGIFEFDFSKFLTEEEAAIIHESN